VTNTPVSEIQGISQGAVVALTRIGVSTLADLLKADFHEVAYALDSYDDAEMLIRAGMKHARSSVETVRTTEKEADVEDGNIYGDLVGPALSAVWDVISEGRTCAEAFDELIRRIGQARLVAELDEEGAATAAALVCDEDGRPIDGTPEEITDLIHAAEKLLTVSMSPGGAVRQAHADRVKEAGPTVRLLVAARALSSLKSIKARLDAEGAEGWSAFDAGREGTIWYYRTILDALGAADESPLVAQLEESIEAIERVPGRRAA